MAQDLARAAAIWDQGGRQTDDVWRGGRLERMVETIGKRGLSLARREQDFVAAGEEFARLTRQQDLHLRVGPVVLWLLILMH